MAETSEEVRLLTAKQYLSSLKMLNIKINHKLQEVEELRALSFSSGGLAADNERVQTSPSGDGRQIALVNRYVDLEMEINQLIDKYVDRKDKIINEIHQLEDARYLEILFKRYVEFKSLLLVSKEMKYDYSHLRHLHGQALKDFERRHTNAQRDML